MRRLLHLTACAVLLAGFPATCHFAPHVLNVVAPPPDPALEAALRREAAGIVATRERRYGHLPPHDWPSHEREVYESARRTLAEMDRRGK
jgi:hypothetical protein